MKKIKMMMDYQCYPIWVYNERGELICNDLINELINEKEIEEMLNDIQNSYDNLFINNKIQFEYKGFYDEISKNEFLGKVSRVIQLIELKLGDEYVVENKVNV